MIVAGSLLLGHIVSFVGIRCRAAAPAVGLSLLILISSVAVQLPGNTLTAALILAVVLLAAGVLAAVRRGAWRFPAVSVGVICLAGLGAAIPFISTGRVGLLGVALDNDSSSHLEYAESLQSAVTRKLYGSPTGYPLGPHRLVVTLARGLGARLDLALTGPMIATVILTALTGANALRGHAGYKRVIIGVFSALLYLVAAYYAEGSFKEQIMGLLLLALVLHLEEVTKSAPVGSWSLWRALIPAALLVAAGVYVYGYLALAWLGLTPAIWLVAEVLIRPTRRLRRWRTQLRELMPATVGAVVVLLILLVPIAGRVLDLVNTFGASPSGTGAITSSMLGNLVSALSPFEALGIWHSIDFRVLPPDQLHAGVLAGLALGVLTLGVVWSLSRRELLLPAAVAVCALIWWRSSHGQSPYVTAKALVIAGPVIAVTGLRGLLGSPRTPMKWSLRLSRLAVAVLFVAFAARSSYEVLANEPVWPPESTNELLTLDKVTRGHTLLFLGATDFTEWLFDDSTMTALAPNSASLGQASPRATNPNVAGAALDFDSVDTAALNHFQYVITTNTPYASQPPQAFRLVRTLPMYQLWKHLGTGIPRQAIDTPGAPGAVLNCRTPAGRALSRERGVASVMPTP